MCLKFIHLYVLTSLLAVAYFSQTNAQDVDRKKADILYIKLPLKALPEEVETYHVHVKPRSTSWGNPLGNIYDAPGSQQMAQSNDGRFQCVRIQRPCNAVERKRGSAGKVKSRAGG